MQTVQHRKSRIRDIKEDKGTKSLANNQVCAMFQMRDIRKNVLPKFMYGNAILVSLNMAAGNQQFSSFPSNG